jgi:23S rRNA (cytidine1920-2'-O)/16S rRNA (cytidine1409-2'-O)-methyltransferase
MVDSNTPIEPVDTERQWVSRGAFKLLAALGAFDIDVAGSRALDVGASTGGFTEVLLDAGAEHVVALDVGRAQLHESLNARTDVTSLEKTNFRLIDPAELGAFSIVVGDVSFISLCALAENLHLSGTDDADYVLLVKPQFEVERNEIGRKGVVVDTGARVAAVQKVIGCLQGAGLGLRGIVKSPVKGSDGNIEYLVWLRKNSESLDLEVPT